MTPSSLLKMFAPARVRALTPVLFLYACGSDAPRPESWDSEPQALNFAILENRSLAVTEAEIVSQFSLEAVLTQLLTQAGVTGQSALDLFRQWASTNSVCSETVNGAIVPQSFNGFPFTCRAGEELREQEPFSGIGAYSVLGLFNRFDLAPANGAHCGEYRIVFGRNEVDASTRKNLIFEARLPNPNPAAGLAACRPVAEFWANLSTIASNATRAERLRTFFMTGLPGFAPVVHLENFQRNALSGRVRTNSFLADSTWSLREFAVRKVCAPVCKLQFVELPTGDNPFFLLSGSSAAHPLAASFQDWFISSLTPGARLLANDINQVVLDAPDRFLMGESLLHEGIGTQTTPPRSIADELAPAFASRIQSRLTALGSSLTPAQLINRADSATCTGCHRSTNGDDVGFGSVPFPNALPFRHVERQLTSGPDGNRFKISDALRTTFLPFRKQVLEQYLNSFSASLTAALSMQSEWAQGYCANVTISNPGTTSADWRSTIVVGTSQITSSWQATFVRAGHNLNVTRSSWQSPLAPGGSTSFGYCATKPAGWAAPTATVQAL